MLPVEVAHRFVDAINFRSAEEIAELVTDDHVFVDSLGGVVEGKEEIKAAWDAYFRMVPDYAVLVDETFAGGDTIIMVGAAQGTYAVAGELREENQWVTPAAWRLMVHGDLVAGWQVYADNEPLRKIMAKAG